MKKNHITIILAIGIIAYFIIEHKKRADEISRREFQNSEEKEALRQMITKLKSEVENIIQSKENLSETIKAQLKDLIATCDNMDEKITNELLSCISLVEIEEESKAIVNFAKIIEKLLIQIYTIDKTIIKERNITKASFFKLIEYAKEDNLISDDEYHFLNAIRSIRNQESHDLDIDKGINKVKSLLLLGIEMVWKLNNYVKKIIPIQP